MVGGIIPWNAPLMQTTCKIGPALAAGNTIVLKTAEQAPLAVLRVFEIIQEVLPPGVANVISGFGEEAGKPLCEHPLVRKITFTGSSAVGAQIMHYAAEKFISVTAELGGRIRTSSCLTPISIWRWLALCKVCGCSDKGSPVPPVPGSMFMTTCMTRS